MILMTLENLLTYIYKVVMCYKISSVKIKLRLLEYIINKRCNTVCNKQINKQILNTGRRIMTFLIGTTILNQKIIYKYDIKIVTEFPCLLGHPE